MAALRLPVMPEQGKVRSQSRNRTVVALAIVSCLASASGARVTGMSLQQALSAAAAGQEIRADANSEPLVRVAAASTNLVLAETNGFTQEMGASGFKQILTTEKLTPKSPVLDHCDRIAALGPRATAWGKRYPAYIAAARKQGEIEMGQHRLTSAELAGFVEGFAGQQSGFERMTQIYGAMASDDATLCEIFARRRWEVTSANVIQFTNEEDKQQALSLFAKLQQRIDEMAALHKGAQAQVKKDLSSLPQ